VKKQAVALSERHDKDQAVRENLPVILESKTYHLALGHE
jgi:hypothetical protein